MNPLTVRVKALSSTGERPPAIARDVGISVPTVYYHLSRSAEPSPRSRGHARAVVAALAYSGLRVSELINLRWRDVHLHAGRLHVTAAKTPRGVREVELTPALREELIDLRAASQREGAKLGPDAFVFATSRGTRRDPNQIRDRLHGRAVQRANERRAERGYPPLPHVTPHTLRRTYISLMLLASRGDIEWVMAQVGHADSETTMRIYSQLLKRQKRDGYGAAFDAMVDDARELVLASDNEDERSLRDLPESTD